MTMTKGIDVSKWQGEIDFSKAAKSGVKFVIIRAGVGFSKDSFFEQNYARAKSAGLHVGAYWYSYADTVSEVRREAAACVSALRGKQFEFPIFFDLEEQSQFEKGREFCSELVTTFCTELENAGYFAGLYCSTYWLTNFVSKEVASRFTLWVAQYAEKCTYSVADYGVWQRSCMGRVDGISGDVDLDECYIDYPSIIVNGGFNGFGKCDVSPEKTITELARECIRGDWGNGSERKRRLCAEGYDYDAVQREINRLLQ